MLVGVLALQGAVSAHVMTLQQLDLDVREVRMAAELATVDALVLPGGESTTIGMLLDRANLRTPLRDRIEAGMPVLATCAGLIVCARDIADGRPDQEPLAVLDVGVQRNAYGRQLDSFETPLTSEPLGIAAADPFTGIFIRAPRITRVGSAVEVLMTNGADPVLVRQGGMWAATFHPELAGDPRIHQAFVSQTSDSPVAVSYDAGNLARKGTR